ncbi:hypothetical protein L596_019551 [Steinernema carpocapsae]|uniref:Uncharacterized protein n=1 Tax=Steinernema carpocapsae TaxID=34508 RepID=A0A4U5MQZ9_STECR|nr:hypothetical protein L596_019551 [Steinernema carpocapsae]
MLKVRYVRHSIHVLLLALILRKVYNGYQAMSFVDQCKGQVSFESLMKSEELQKVVQKLNSENTLILMQNQHAVNMTMNWLCNTEDMEGMHENVSIGFGRAPIDGVFGLGWPALRHFNATRPIENINPQLGKAHLHCLYDHLKPTIHGNEGEAIIFVGYDYEKGLERVGFSCPRRVTGPSMSLKRLWKTTRPYFVS